MLERELAEKHAIEHQESQCLTPAKMTRNAGDVTSKFVAPVSPAKSTETPGEIRTVDPLTGGEKGTKIERYDLIPPEFLNDLAKLYGTGARKYADRNWERGYKWSLSLAAHGRHLNKHWLMGENTDQETDVNHLINAIWHLVALYTFQTRGIGTDDIRRSK